MNVMRTWLLSALLVMLVAVDANAQAWERLSERWYTLSLSGAPCGLSHELVERRGREDGSTEFRSIGEIEMRFRRLGEVTEIQLRSEFIESARGEPIAASVSQGAGAVVRWSFDAKEKRATKQEGNALPQPIAWPSGPWLTPRAVERFVAARLSAGAAEISYTSLDLQSGCVPALVTMTRRSGASAKEFDVKNSLVPLIACETYAKDGALLSSVMPIGIGDLASMLSDEPAARAALASGKFDLLQGTLITSERIPNAARLARATFRVTTTGDAIALPSVASQVAQIDPASTRSMLVDVDIDRRNPVIASDAADTRWTMPNAMIDSDNPAIKELLAKRKASPTPEQLRSFVAEHLSAKNFKTAFGSASEAALSRSGDCTEHAVLLAALLRASGTPSRVVSGVVYVEGIGGQASSWGWHMWTQALVDVRSESSKETVCAWIDLDATLRNRFNAAHIAVAVSDLSAGATDPAFLNALALLGKIKIEQVDVRDDH